MEQLTDEQIEQYVEAIRSRRLVVVLAHAEMVAAKNKIRAEVVLKKIDRKIGLLQKLVDKADELVEKALGYQAEIRGFKIQAIDLGEDIEIDA